MAEALQQEPIDSSTVKHHLTNAARIYESFAFILINEPDEQVLKTYDALRMLIDDEQDADRSQSEEPISGKPVSAAPAAEVPLSLSLNNVNSLNAADLRQRYFDRFFVTTSPVYMPLSEQCVRKAQKIDEHWRFGQKLGSYTTHVAECYRIAAFDFRKLIGFEPAIQSLATDSLAAETAFIGYLLSKQLESNAAAGRQWNEFREKFIDEHLGQWVVKAAAIMASQADDIYAETVALLAKFIALENAVRTR